MNFYSQARQDEFVLALAGRHIPKLFLDIGCGGRSISNTLALEERGWTGMLLDNSPEAEKDSKGRKAQFILTDATKYKWPVPLLCFGYASIDIDYASLDALKNIPLGDMRFGIITIEHDSWRFGEELRTPMLRILKEHGYDVLCADVCNPDPFEIWAVDPECVDMEIAERFRSNKPTHCNEFFK